MNSPNCQKTSKKKTMNPKTKKQARYMNNITKDALEKIKIAIRSERKRG